MCVCVACVGVCVGGCACGCGCGGVGVGVSVVVCEHTTTHRPQLLTQMESLSFEQARGRDPFCAHADEGLLCRCGTEGIHRAGVRGGEGAEAEGKSERKDGHE